MSVSLPMPLPLEEQLAIARQEAAVLRGELEGAKLILAAIAKRHGPIELGDADIVGAETWHIEVERPVSGGMVIRQYEKGSSHQETEG